MNRMDRRGALAGKSWALLIAAGGLAMLGGDCDGDVVQDPTFRDWCGSALCSWTLDSGQIKRVPTWNENDFGVSFDQAATQISQVTRDNGASCLLFTTMANIDPSAQMSLLVDFNNDGTIDSRQTLGATQWHRLQTQITAPASYSGITFHVRKDGTGAAVLAEVRVQATSNCSAPVSLAPLLFGEGCTSDAQCAAGLVCDGSKVCAECDEHTPCTDGSACVRRSLGFPAQCGGGQLRKASGAACVLGDDCASGVCAGASAVSLAAAFAMLDAGGPDGGYDCPSAPPGCDLVDASQSSTDPCQCTFERGGRCH